MHIKFIFVIFVLILGAGAVAFFNMQQPEVVQETSPEAVADHKDATYMIEGIEVKLENGRSENTLGDGSQGMAVTEYFGNELYTDLNGDGREDVAFILTQTSGGSGTFFYAVGALNTPEGFVGSDGYLLGDRVAPQSTVLSDNPRHVHVVVFNYADRLPTEPMSAEPSVGKSVYLKLDARTMQWGIVEPDFEGEAR